MSKRRPVALAVLAALAAGVSALAPAGAARPAGAVLAGAGPAAPSGTGALATPEPPPVRDANRVSGHEDAEGLKLIAEAGESVRRAAGCPRGAPVRDYDVVAISVDITLNRFLDHDPQ